MATHGLMLVERSIALMMGTEKLDTEGKVVRGLVHPRFSIPFEFIMGKQHSLAQIVIRSA